MGRIVALVVLPFLAFTAMAAKKPVVPTYPIALGDVRTTLDSTVACDSQRKEGQKKIFPCQLAEYEANGYGKWWYGAGYACVGPNILTDSPDGAGCVFNVPYPPAAPAVKLLSFFSFSDIHITDKESPAQRLYFGYQNYPYRESADYSGIILSTTHVLDAAVQTINAIHQKAPFDFGISLGDACNNTQRNELQWYVDVLDGKKITPSSGAHKGAKTIGYQKPYQSAGLDPSLPWYQVIGNHDQSWSGAVLPDAYIKKTLVGGRVLNIGPIPPVDPNTRGYYTGVVDGTTPYGTVIDAGATSYFPKPPRVVADPRRRSLSIQQWIGVFMKSKSLPIGHGFTKETAKTGFACYSFHPKAGVPIKVIALDDTDKQGGATGELDNERYTWLVNELDAGEAAGELMIICAHVPVAPNPSNHYSTFSPHSNISAEELLAKLWTYKNLLLWNAGHIHRNAITAQASPDKNPENSFWEVETPSLREYPQQFRRFDIYRDGDNNIVIYALDVDPAVNPALLADGSHSPAWNSRFYAVGGQQIFGNIAPVTGTHIISSPTSGVCNAALVKQLTPAMRAKISKITKE